MVMYQGIGFAMEIEFLLLIRKSVVKRVFFLLFYPNRLVKMAIKHTPSADPEQIKNSIGIVRHHVFRGLRISGGTALFSVLIYLILSFSHINIGHRILIIFRFFGYMFVLWGVFSPAGWKIQTIGGETLPEIIDEEWHRLIYMIGLTLLLLSYLFEI